MPTALRHPRRHRPAAPTTPADVTIRTDMLVDDASEPTEADVKWSTVVDNRPGNPACALDERGTLSLWLYVGNGAIEGRTCTVDELTGLAQALVALADRVKREHHIARLVLIEWRARYNKALEPMAVE